MANTVHIQALLYVMYVQLVAIVINQLNHQTKLTGRRYCNICSRGTLRLFKRKKIESIFNLGHYCPNPAGNTILCKPGYANDRHGRVECDLCPSESYANETGFAYYITCTPGYIYPNPRAASVPCPSNTGRGQIVCANKCVIQSDVSRQFNSISYALI
jgi:hypothetical protein